MIFTPIEAILNYSAYVTESLNHYSPFSYVIITSFAIVNKR